MYKCKPEGGVPVYSYIPKLDYLAEPDMMIQIENASKLPFVFHHVALMPDGHVGYGVPIGSVLALDGAVSPFSE